MNKKEPSNGNGKETSFWVVSVLVVLIGPFMAILDSSIVNVAIPTIMHVFNTNTSTVEWVVTIYMLALGVVVPLSNWLGNRLGLKTLYILSLSVFTLGSLLCAFSWSITSLIVSRVVQAVGGGMIMPTTMSMIYSLVPRESFGSAMGIFGIALMVAPAIGPTLGGYLVEYVNWRWIFTINLPIGILGILLAYLILSEFPRSKAGKLDVGGALTAGTGLFCLLLALNKGNDWGWGSEKIVLLLYTSAVSLGLFVFLELTCENPLLDLRVFRYPTFTLANLMLVIVTICLNAGVFYVPLFLQNIRGLGAMKTGLLMMPAALVSGLMMPIAGRLFDRTGPRAVSITGLLILAYTTFLFHRLDLNTPFSVIQLWLVMRSVGMSLGMMPPQTAAISSVPPHMVGQASAINNIISRVSGSFGIAILTSILNKRQNLHSAVLAANISPYNPAVEAFFRQVESRLGTGAASTAEARSLALAYLQGAVSKMSFVRALDDIFVIMTVIVVFALIPVLFIRKGSGSERTHGVPSME